MLLGMDEEMMCFSSLSNTFITTDVKATGGSHSSMRACCSGDGDNGGPLKACGDHRLSLGLINMVANTPDCPEVREICERSVVYLLSIHLLSFITLT